jgi:Family of unknown function (DUF6644)
MSLYQFAHWLGHTEWALDFSSSSYLYPAVMATHLICIAMFGGMIFMTNMRLLGWGLKSQPVSAVIGRLRPWKRAGFVVMVTCGLLLAGSEFNKYYDNPYFWIKISLLVLIGVHGLAFRRSVYYNTAALDAAPVMPRPAKLAGALSLVLWISVVIFGRMIGYYERPPSELGSMRGSPWNQALSVCGPASH